MNLKAVYEEVAATLDKRRHFCVQLELIHYGLANDPTFRVSIYDGVRFFAGESPDAALAAFREQHVRKVTVERLASVADVQVPVKGVGD